MVAVNVMLFIVALVLLLGVIGEKDKEKNRNVTIAFVAVIVLLMALNRGRAL